MKKLFSIIFLSFLFVNITYAQAPVYISQVQITGGKNNTQEDFIELFNPNASPVNLKGCRLVKRAAGATSDTLVKSFSKDTFIPAKSFFLWANSGYASISAKPDVSSSATISNDTGIALRFGANDSGVILDSVAWGKGGGEFNNVSPVNPDAGQALAREDLYAAASQYTIAPSQPHNSSVNDLAAAFGASQQPATQAPGRTSVQVGTPPQKTTSSQTALASATPSQPPVAGIQTVAGDNEPAGQPQSSPGYGTQPNQNSPNARNYLFLAAGALLALGFLCYQFFWKKPKTL